MPGEELERDNSENTTDKQKTDKIILQQVFSINKTLLQMSSDIAEIKEVKECVDKHEKVLYGNQEKMGEGGIIYTLNSLKKEASIVAAVVATGVSAVFTVVLTLFTNKR